MMKRTILTFLVTVGLLASQLAYAPSAHAGLFDDAKKDACAGANLTASGTCTSPATGGLDTTIANVIDILTVVIGIIAVIMIIINGLKLITSGGDANKVGSAKNGILYAIIGLAVVALAQFLVRFVINKTG